jgi:hypothetical protein
MSINIANLIRPDCFLVLPNNQIISAHEIKVLTNLYKRKIYEACQGKTVGKVALIWSNDVNVLLPCIKALWQLGCVISVHDYSTATATHPSFKNFYKHLDIVIGPPVCETFFPHLTYVPGQEFKLNISEWENGVPQSSFEWQPTIEEFPDVEYKLDKPLVDSLPAVLSHSSGTTGNPKIFSISHKEGYQLVQENIKIFGFNENDRVLHNKTLHHGSLFLNFSIPAYATTNEHHWVRDKMTDSQVDFLSTSIRRCADKKLTKWLIPYNNIDQLLECNEILTPDLEMVSIVGPTKETLGKILNKFKIKKFYNNFGCTEVGTIAVSATDLQNIDHYDSRTFTRINSLLDITVFPYHFNVKYKISDSWKTINDKIEISNDLLKFYGRNTTVTVNDNEINVGMVNELLTSLINPNFFTLVPDFERHKFYLALYKDTTLTLEQINTTLQLTIPYLKIDTMQRFESPLFIGVKPSQPLLLYAFRNLTQ